MIYESISEFKWVPIDIKVAEEQAKEAEETEQFFCWMCLPGNSSGPLRRSCLCVESEMRSMKSHGATAKELYEYGLKSLATLQNGHAELFQMKIQFRLWQDKHQTDCCKLKERIDFENYHSYNFDYTPNSYGVVDNLSNLLASTAESASQAASSFFKFAEQVDPNYDPFLPIPGMPLEPEKIDCHVLKPEFGIFEKQTRREQQLKNFEAICFSERDDMAGIMAIVNASSYLVNKVEEGINGWASEIGSNIANQAEAICNKNPLIHHRCQQIKNLPGAAEGGMKKVNEVFDHVGSHIEGVISETCNKNPENKNRCQQMGNIAKGIGDAVQNSEPQLLSTPHLQNGFQSMLSEQPKHAEKFKQAFSSVDNLYGFPSGSMQTFLNNSAGLLLAVNPLGKASKPLNTGLKSILKEAGPGIEYYQKRQITKRTAMVFEDIGISTEEVIKNRLPGRNYPYMLDGWMTKKNNVFKIKLENIQVPEGRLSNWLSVMSNFKAIAKANQAEVLHFEAQIINEQLLDVMIRRYGKPLVEMRTIREDFCEYQIFKIPVQ